MKTWVFFASIAMLLAGPPAALAGQDARLPAPAGKLEPPKPPPADFGQPLGRSLDLANAGNYQQAIIAAKESLALAERELGPEDGTVAKILHILARYHLMLGQDDEARALLERELRIGRHSATARDVDLAIANALGELARSLEFDDPPKTAQAAPLLRHALEINERVYGRDSSHVAAAAFDLATNSVLREDFADAEIQYKRALETFEKTGSSKTNVLVVLNDLASMYMKQKRYADAEPLLARAVASADAELAPDNALSAELHEHMATLRKERGRQNAAREKTH